MFRRLLTGKQRGLIGLDVSDGSLEAAQLRSSSRSTAFQLAGWSRAVLPPGVITAGKLAKPNEFGEVLRRLLAKPTFGSLDGRQVVLSLPEHQCYHYVIPLQSWDSDGGLYNQVQSQLTTRLPLPLDEAYWDWQVVRQETSRLFVYIAAVPREILDPYRQTLRALGLVVASVEPQLLSAERLLWPTQTLAEPMLFLDIGTQETAIATIDDLGIHQSSVAEAGIGPAIAILSRKLKSQPDVIEKVIKTIGLRNVKHDKTALIHEAINEQVRLILAEASQHVSYYQSQTHVTPALIKNVVMVGGGSLIPGVPEAITHELKLTPVVPAPYVTIKPALEPQDIALLANALGSAIRGTYQQERAAQEINMLVTRRSYERAKASPFAFLGRLFKREKKDETPKAPPS